jgi:hypothetical protein
MEKKIGFELLPHTADITVRAVGRSLEEAFAYAVIGLFGVMTNVESIEPREKTRGHSRRLRPRKPALQFPRKNPFPVRHGAVPCFPRRQHSHRAPTGWIHGQGRCFGGALRPREARVQGTRKGHYLPRDAYLSRRRPLRSRVYPRHLAVSISLRKISRFF